MNIKIPRWMLILSYIFALLGLAVGFSLYFLPPQTFIPGINPNAQGVSYLVQMWAARQIAIGSIIGYSAFKKSLLMLKASLLIYLVMQIQDIIIGILQNDNGLAIGASVIGLVTAAMIYSLSKTKNV